MSKYRLSGRLQEGKDDVYVFMLSCVSLSATPRTVVHQVSLTMEFSRQEYWSGLPVPTPGDLPDPGVESASPVSPALTGRFFTTVPSGKPEDNLDGTFKMELTPGATPGRSAPIVEPTLVPRSYWKELGHHFRRAC